VNTPVNRDDDVTSTGGRDVERTLDSDSVDGRPPTPGRFGGRFTPGTIFAGRYRLVALLGRGGMGEVYRAEDLTLDQPVALKFLPERVAADALHLARFHNELRVARQVSHKNVCRLYDLGESNGHRFLTMEYVDGEDLASLLRRIGRFPQDRAVAIARQLCAGVAAAHDRNVIHRDLKPANVMIDGDGNVRITDFGIATVETDTRETLVGTPHYMAPEQLNGKPASIKTDIYSLGLVLFEVFTGKRVYDAPTLSDLRAMHDTGTITTPSAIVSELDPTIERVILRCLDKDPDRRPASALAVAAALPGADALAAALAAGETPSPELLAAAGEAEPLPVVRGLVGVAWIVAGMLLAAALAPAVTIARLVPLDKPPEVLADRAEQILATFGYEGPRGDTAQGFAVYNDYFNWLGAQDRSAARWDRLSSGTPPALIYWYRTSPRDLIPRPLALGVTPNDPPPNDSGMHTVVLDTRGQLVQFNSVPPQFDPSAVETSTGPPWPVMFTAAGLDIARFSSAASQWNPRDFADARAAFEGPLPTTPTTTVRVEGASYRDHPIAFGIFGPWSRPTRMQPLQRSATDRIANAIFTVLIIALVIGALVLARHNIRVQRADRRGATRVAVLMVVFECLLWLVGTHHVADVRVEVTSFTAILADAVLASAILWIMYVALEPYCRRFWPAILIGWSRLLSGRIRDPRVGRDVLIGMSVGVVWLLLDIGRRLTPTLLDLGPMPRFGYAVETLLGAPNTIVIWILLTLRQVAQALGFVLMFVVLRLLTKRAWAAIAIGMLLLFVWWSEFGGAPSRWLEFSFELAIVALFTLTVIRFGLLAAAVALTVSEVSQAIPLTLQFAHWSATASNLTLAAIALLAIFGFYASRAGQPLFGTLEPSQ
jgi:serine/threonine-protein kinase